MVRELFMLHKNDLAGEIEIHSDFLSLEPSALSRKRALKTGREKQEPMKDPNGPENCILCDPQKKPQGTSMEREIIKDRVACFENDFPYLPGDQQVIYLAYGEQDSEIRKKFLHRYKLEDFGRSELYWLVKGSIILGNNYPIPDRTYDLMRMVVGFNLGKLAGQSIPHFHIQYGWEVVLDRRTISQKAIDLYFEELEFNDLIIYSDDRLKVIAPWTPKGQFALDIYFNDKFEISEMDETDIRTFAVIGNRIIKKYRELGIENLNIVFSNSPKGRKIEPLIVHFVPRVNMTALYEIKGVNVVDTPPNQIAVEFRRPGPDGSQGINWSQLIQESSEFDPDQLFMSEIELTESKQTQRSRTTRRKS